MFASVLRTGIVWVATGLAGLLSTTPSSPSWQFDLLDQVTESQQPPQPTAPAKLPTWEFNLVDRPAWNFQLTTVDVGDADAGEGVGEGEVVAEPAAWRFTLTDEECHRAKLCTYREAYDRQQKSGKWIWLEVGGTIEAAEKNKAIAMVRGYEFAWEEAPFKSPDGEVRSKVGWYPLSPPAGVACKVIPAEYLPNVVTPVLQWTAAACAGCNCPAR